mmetsp:Transcript_16365/g.37735  ORF Transcript_16365/g.37735 Transcript_16365/m.37735 type:complete len:482 (-) Transcript_16365:164-1609(-)
MTMGGKTSKKQPSAFHKLYRVGGRVWCGDTSQVRVVRSVGGNLAIQLDNAVKVCDLRIRTENGVKEEVNKRLVRDVQAEASVWLKAGVHENILQLIKLYIEEPVAYFVTELCDYSLLYVLERMPQLSEVPLARFFRGIARALAHLDDHGVIHRDVRPENVLCTGKRFTVKLSGFGSACTAPKAGVRGEAGVAGFMSPEMVSGLKYTGKTDVWSLGVMSYLLFYGDFPHKSADTSPEGIKQAIKVGMPAPTFRPWASSRKNTVLSPKADEFCQALLSRVPKQRPTAIEALQLQYLMDAESSEEPPEEDGQKQTLLPNLCGAVVNGGFGLHLADRGDTDIDFLLNFEQYKFHGSIVSWTRPRPQASLLKAALDRSTFNLTEDQEALPQTLNSMTDMQRALKKGQTVMNLGQNFQQAPDMSFAMQDLRRKDSSTHSRENYGDNSLTSFGHSSQPLESNPMSPRQITPVSPTDVYDDEDGEMEVI